MKDITDEQVIHAVLKGKQTGEWPYDILMRETGQPEKVCWRCLERADNRDYLDCGVSLRTAWVTEKGYALIGEEVPQ